MGYVDFILNLAGLLLWLNWRSIRFDPLAKRTPATLMGTLRPAAPKKLQRWHLLAFLGGLLVLRAMAYRWIAPFWVGKLDWGVIVTPFRSDQFTGMLLFSFFSFGLALGTFYLCLLPLSLLGGPDPIRQLVKIPLGRVDGWPRGLKLLLPLLAGSALWWFSSWLLVGLHICTPPVSTAHQIEQSLVIGLCCYLAWKFPLGALLTLHILGSYIYFGKHPLWNYVKMAAQELLRPLKMLPLRLGRVDFAPVLAIVILFSAAEFAGRMLNAVFLRLPF